MPQKSDIPRGGNSLDQLGKPKMQTVKNINTNHPVQGYALVTGASSGIGRAISLELARKGVDLILVSNQEAELHSLRDAIIGTYTLKVHIYCVDLSTPDAPEQVLQFCESNALDVDLLVNNAGVFSFGPLTALETVKINLMLSLHTYCVTHLCRLFAEKMKNRRHGYILNNCSISAWMPMPGITIYNATKAYLKNFSLALYYELKPYNVAVTTLCPGGIDTPLFGLSPKLRKLGKKFGFLMAPEKLARIAVSKCLKRKKQSIPGISNHIFVFFMRFIPDFLVFFLMRRIKIYRTFLP